MVLKWYPNVNILNESIYLNVDSTLYCVHWTQLWERQKYRHACLNPGGSLLYAGTQLRWEISKQWMWCLGPLCNCIATSEHFNWVFNVWCALKFLCYNLILKYFLKSKPQLPKWFQVDNVTERKELGPVPQSNYSGSWNVRISLSTLERPCLKELNEGEFISYSSIAGTKHYDQ